MTPTSDMTLEDLARLAVTLPGWRWMAGMLTDTGYRVIRPANKAPDEPCPMGVAEDDGTDPEPWPLAYNWLPDLSDPATLGCVRVLVSEAAGQRVGLVPVYGAGGTWLAQAVKDGEYGPTEAHALVALWQEVTRAE